MATTKQYKCFNCKELIKQENDIDFIQEGVNSKGRTVNKRFHKSKKCYEVYLNRQKEFKEFCDLNEYIKLEFMGYKKGMNLSSYSRNKLQSLRTGKFIVRKGEKITNEGYPYSVILSTLKLKKQEILRGIIGKTFNGENHKFDYIMVIASNSINDVYKRYLNKSRQNNNMQKINIDTTNTKEEYKNKHSNKMENKVANLLKDMM